MAIVKAQPGQSSDQVIRAFQKKVLAEDIMGELDKRKFHQKPSLIKKNKMLARRHPNRRTY